MLSPLNAHLERCVIDDRLRDARARQPPPASTPPAHERRRALVQWSLLLVPDRDSGRPNA